MEDLQEAARAIEALVMVADEPIEPSVLAQLLEIPLLAVEELCDTLNRQYDAEHRGFVLTRVAGGYRYQSHPDMAPYIERFVLEGQSARLSGAAMETLAIVAYKQPISRMQIAAIRGVNVDGVLRTLQQRGYVAEVARDPGPGNAVLYGTTPLFLERLGLDAVQDLPPLGQFVPGADVVEALEYTLRFDPVPADVITLDESPEEGAIEESALEGGAPAERPHEPAGDVGEPRDEPVEDRA